MKANTNQEHRHETLGGHALVLKGITPEQLGFLARVRDAAADSSVTVDDLTNLVWSGANPLLVTDLLPGRAMATRETYDNPAFREMLDWIGRKRVATGDLVLERAQARYTMTVPEAAESLGVAESTVRRAVQEGRLAGWKKGGAYYVDPVAVESYRVSTRGTRAEVRIEEGRANRPREDEGPLPQGTLKVKQGTQGDYFLRKLGALGAASRAQKGSPVWEETIPPTWRRIALLRGKKKEQDYRYFELEPAIQDNDKEMVLTFADFYVRGAFRIVRTINNPRKAIEAWESFEAS